MKLQELAAISPTKQAAKVFESYFGNSVSFDHLNRTQARNMLNRVRSLIKEHRSQPSFHTSEQNPSYMKLIVLEQGLASKLNEADIPAPVAGTQVAPNPANMAMQVAQRRKQIDDQIKALQKQIQDLQQQRSNPALGMAESKRKAGLRLNESEVQQAQVVLASQDMVDQVQKMLEQVTSMQFKDLPALTDQVKNQVGVDQAMQFNSDATAALAGLVQNLQASKLQLEQALGVVTGQGATIPGEDSADDLGAELDGEEIPAPDLDVDADIDLDAEIEEPEAGAGAADLGRTRR